jgi:thymidylate synthase (FAD)
MKINCLDKGSVELITNTCKGDLLVVNAARCSFDKQHEIFDHTKDAKLIHYLAKHEHLLPFRHPSATIRIHAPIFVLRQLGKHQVGFSWSEVSRRYITGEPEFWLPDSWRSRPDNIKQGSEGELRHSYQFSANITQAEIRTQALEGYKKLLDLGVAPEQARAVLPQSMYTTTITTGTLLGWHHMFTQRTEEHTQLETQEYAKAIGQIMSDIFPVSWEALCEHLS